MVYIVFVIVAVTILIVSYLTLKKSDEDEPHEINEVYVGYTFNDGLNDIIVTDINSRYNVVTVEKLNNDNNWNSYSSKAETFGFYFKENKLYKK
jgi:hypothetical protein